MLELGKGIASKCVGREDWGRVDLRTGLSVKARRNDQSEERK
jgi:hypothetical protein